MTLTLQVRLSKHTFVLMTSCSILVQLQSYNLCAKCMRKAPVEQQLPYTQVLASRKSVLSYSRRNQDRRNATATGTTSMPSWRSAQSQQYTGARVVQAADGYNRFDQSTHPDGCPHHLSGRSTSTMRRRPGAIDPPQLDTYTKGTPLPGEW